LNDDDDDDDDDKIKFLLPSSSPWRVKHLLVQRAWNTLLLVLEANLSKLHCAM